MTELDVPQAPRPPRSTIAVVTEEPTPASVWQAVAGSPIGDELL
jgi:hypothetical protein